VVITSSVDWALRGESGMTINLTSSYGNVCNGYIIFWVSYRLHRIQVNIRVKFIDFGPTTILYIYYVLIKKRSTL